MPRIVQRPDRVDHDFAWSFFLKASHEEPLFSRQDTIWPSCWNGHVGRWGDLNVQNADRTLVLVDLRCSRPDVIVKVRIGRETRSFSGPWLASDHDGDVPSLQELLSIYDDARAEDKQSASTDIMRQAFQKIITKDRMGIYGSPPVIPVR